MQGSARKDVVLAAGVYPVTVPGPKWKSWLSSYDEERRAEGEHEEAFEIDVGPIHDVEGTGLGADLVEDVDVVHCAVGNADQRGDVARRSSSVCIFTAALRRRNLAHGNSARQRSMVVESRA